MRIDKRHLHHTWTIIRPIKTQYLLTAFLACLLVYVFALRANNTGMVTRRDAVYVADKQNQGVEAALQELRSYVGSHMNTNLYTGKGVYPPVQLKHTYDRLVQAEQDRVNNTNSQNYSDAQKHCETLDPNSPLGRSRVPCIEAYIKAHGSTTARTVPDALYKFDFLSPRWSPDLAGWMLVVSVIAFVLLVIRFALGWLLRSITK